MTKKYIAIVLILISMIVGSGAGVFYGQEKQSDLEHNRIYIECIEEYDGLDDLLERADQILIGEIIEINQHEEYDEYEVKVFENIKGNCCEQLFVRNYLFDYSYYYNGIEYSSKTNLNYQVGQKYLFILQHIYNVYDDRYVIMSNAYIPFNNTLECEVLSMKISTLYNNPVEYIKNYEFKNEQGVGSQLSMDYIINDDISEVVKNSKYTVRVELVEIYNSTDITDIYLCNVLTDYKGNINTTEDGKIIVPFFKDSVSAGDIVIVNLNSDTDDALIYNLSAVNGVIEENNEEIVTDILR